MSKLVAAFFMVFAVGFLSVGSMSAAHAYGDPTKTVQDAPQVVSQSDAQGAAAATTSTNAPLPGTGGPNELLLVGGAALLLAGGASVVIARRRPTS